MPRLAALASVLAMLSSLALAQAQSAAEPRTRAAVKAETRALLHSGELGPAGAVSAPVRASPAANRSALSVADRQAETLEARRRGELAPAGDAADARAERHALSAPSVRSREERKADTRAALRAGLLLPAGEGIDAPRH